MTYKVYIKKDYKPEIRWVPERPWHQRRPGLLAISLCAFLALGACALYLDFQAAPVPAREAGYAAAKAVPVPIASRPDVPTVALETAGQVQTSVDPVQPKTWQTVEIKKGDNLSLIFDRLGLGPTLLYQVINAGEDTDVLKRLMPGQELAFLIDGGEFQSLRFEPDLVTTLEIRRTESGYASELSVTELERRPGRANGTIDSSLFLAGQDAGLSDRLIMEMVSLFGWDIDFALDIRSGDEFNVVYEELYKEDVKVGDGPILAAEFVNRRESYRAVRYTSPDGDTSYFNENGISMRKAFLRTPLKFSRISSRFNLRRKHPVLNRIRAHRGVDYAAPTGTPIKATGDGTVILAGRKGGYGKTVILKHGGNRSTLYAHMSSFSRNIKRGKRVKQGQIIGYVGRTGLATGPHLHYEFQVNGVHRNPLTVKLPKASGVPKKFLADFRQQSAPLLARLDSENGNRIATSGSVAPAEKSVIALDDSRPAKSVVH